MAKQVQFRRGTTSQHSTFTGVVGEITVDTDKNTAVVHDGSTAGGHPLTTSLADLGVTASAADLNTTDVTTLGTVEASKVVTADSNADIKFSDGDKILIGDDADLEIYHDGSNSWINETGTGNLLIGGGNEVRITSPSAGEFMATFNNNGPVNLYYDNTKRFETTSVGIDVTGTAEVDTLKFSDNTTQTSAGASTGKAIAMAIVFGG